MTRKTTLRLTAMAVAGALATGAAGQMALPAPEPTDAQGRPVSAGAVVPPPPPSTQELMRANGNSLVQAQLAQPAATNTATLQDVSFFAVPQPEPRVIRKHDLVTIIIREQSDSSNEGTTETEKSMDLEAELEEFIKLDALLTELSLTGGGISAPTPRIAFNAGREFEGDGTVERSDSFTARITAEVLDVKPNGTIVLQARKRIINDEEEQLFIITGTCRGEDVTPDNTILSTELHDAEIIKQTRGAVRDSTKRGFIPRALDTIGVY